MGSVVISIDAELGWGFHDLPEPPTTRVEAGRDGWDHLLQTFETYDVPATWAVVGHLLLNDCDSTHATHSSLDGWFARENGSWRDRPDLRFATDLIERTLEAEPDHEIACHTFSHAIFDDSRITREIARAEVRAAIDAARPYGIEYDSFVFPRNAVDHKELLAESGFRAYRSRATVAPTKVRRAAAKLVSAVLPRPPLVEPTVDEYGMVDIPPSLFLFGFEGAHRRIATSVMGGDPIVRQAKRGIDRAAREDGVFHMWLHPNNIRTERDEHRIRTIVAYAAATREETPLTIETMADVADRTVGRDALEQRTAMKDPAAIRN